MCAKLIGSTGLATGLAGALWVQLPQDLRDPYRSLPSSGNANIDRIERASDQAWSVQILADIQDGFLYVPTLMREADAQGVDAIVIAGDLARGGGGAHLPLLLDQLRQARPEAPLFAVPGNHDSVNDQARQNFVTAFGSPSFEFTIGSTRFIGLDSTQEDESDSLEQVRNALATAEREDEHVVIVRHHSPLPSAEYYNPRSSDVLVALLEHPRVAAVVTGHAHHWGMHDRSGVRFLTVPASGDRGHGQDQTVVSYLILRWDGSAYSFEHHFVPRRNTVELETILRHLFDGHVKPAVLGAMSTWTSRTKPDPRSQLALRPTEQHPR